MTPEQQHQMNELRQRNEKRLEKAKAALGTKWLLHPSNMVQRKPMELRA